jgi:hypothetical protein
VKDVKVQEIVEFYVVEELENAPDIAKKKGLAVYVTVRDL